MCTSGTGIWNSNGKIWFIFYILIFCTKVLAHNWKKELMENQNKCLVRIVGSRHISKWSALLVGYCVVDKKAFFLLKVETAKDIYICKCEIFLTLIWKTFRHFVGQIQSKLLYVLLTYKWIWLNWHTYVSKRQIVFHIKCQKSKIIHICKWISLANPTFIGVEKMGSNLFDFNTNM